MGVPQLCREIDSDIPHAINRSVTPAIRKASPERDIGEEGEEGRRGVVVR